MLYEIFYFSPVVVLYSAVKDYISSLLPSTSNDYMIPATLITNQLIEVIRGCVLINMLTHICTVRIPLTSNLFVKSL